MKPLSYPQKRLLSLIEANPGLSRSELGKLAYAEMNPYYSLKKVSKMTAALEKRGLLEYGVIHEGGRAGVPGVYLKGSQINAAKNILGVFGRKDDCLKLGV